jgi:hypothetical protein
MATRVLFLYNNLISSATLTASSSATGFPVANLKNPFRTKVWRTAGGTAGTANLVVNHGSAKAVNCIALAGYNWAAAPGTLDIEFHASDAWGAPSAHEHITWAANPTAQGNHGVIVMKFDSKSYQYNRLNVVYSPSATPTDWNLGVLFLGTYFEPTYSFKPDWTLDINDESIGSKTIGGQDHFDQVGKFRSMDVGFSIVSQAQWESFQAMIHSVGRSKDLFIAFDYDDDPDEMTVYGKFTKLPGAKVFADYAFDANFSFRESR